MPIPVLMPALSPTMEEGTLAKWHVKEGDTVEPGDVIAEIETDKATMEVEAVDEGRVGKLLVAEGATAVPVNRPIALLLEEGEGPEVLDDFSPGAGERQDGGASMQESAAKTAGPEDQPTRAKPAPTGAGGGAGVGAGTGAGDGEAGGRIKASPLARRLAKERGIALAALTGTGPHGRIVKRDVEKAARTGIAPAGAETPAAGLPAGMSDDIIRALFEEGSYDIVPHDNMRKTIARRLVEAKLTIPHFYLSIDCRLDALLEARKRLNEAGAEADPPYRISVNDFIIKAMGLALKQVPEANATWTEAGRLMHHRADVGVAVAVEGGLFTPVVRDADKKTLSDISIEMKNLAARARKRRLAPHEYQGGTTSISNLGMFGIKSFSAVINPPHATILAVGQGERRPVVGEDGHVSVATVMSCTLSCDHRVVDGALGARLLGAFRRLIEDPVRMLA